MISINQSTTSLSFIERIQKERDDKTEQLSSGLKINKASDDAAGLQIANRLSSQISGLSQLADNARDQVNLNNVADAQYSSITQSLQRANELSIQSGSPLGSNGAIQGELDQLTGEINAIAEQALGQSNFIAGLDAGDPAATQAAIEQVLSAIGEQATSNGADTNALASEISTYQVTRDNSSASRSRIQDTDYASATSEQQKNDLLLQAALITQRNDQERKGLLINQLV
ncbi:MAG: flagellin [Gammaproteobacteria bacterium]|nr:flagellin [Gammaproteobacteria bacterium]